MVLPFFYKEDINLKATELVLEEDTSKHIAHVLRMQNGEQVRLTDGKGQLCVAEIIDNNKIKCLVRIIFTTTQPPPVKKITIGISLIKNSHRFEWFLEKATEIGVSEIVPLVCSRTEKQHFRAERMKSILISAMLQSQQCRLTELHEPLKYSKYIKEIRKDAGLKKFIAHCNADEPRIQLPDYRPFSDSIILIGPEGDFTIDEIELALQNDFLPVAFGNTRLRSETAGVVAATILSLA